MVPVGGHGHLKSKRWFEISNVIHVKIKQCRDTHLSSVKLSLSELSIPWQKSRPRSWACLSVISNPKALSSVWPVPFLNCQVCPMLFFRHSLELISNVISYVKNYSLILARYFSINLYFHMWNYKIAMAIFRTSPCQDGDEVLKCHEWRCQGIKRRFRKPEQTREHIKKDCKRYFEEKKNLSQISVLNVRESGVFDRSIDRYDPG